MSFLFPMTVSGPYGAYTVDAVVDPDATFSAVPSPALVEMGIDPIRVVQLRDARGSKRFYRLGRALVTVAGVEDLAPVLFVDAGEPTVIGATTLALLMLEPDEAEKTLVPAAGRIGSSTAAKTNRREGFEVRRDPIGDAAYVTILSDGEPASTVRLTEDLAIDLTRDGQVYGIEILSASDHSWLVPDNTQ